MKILQLATVDHGGATYFLRDALLQHTEHECRAVRTYNGGLRYPHDLILDPEQDAEELAGLYDWAEVVHLHDEAGALVQEFAPKPTIVTYHGSRYRQHHEQLHPRAVRRGWLVTVSTLDLAEWGGEWLPTPRRDVAGDWRPVERFVVVHAPTDRERKRTELILEALSLFPVQLIEGQPYRKCLQKKAKGRLLVDGWLGYGNNAVEAWALGMPVASGAPMDLEERMVSAWGYLPFVLLVPDAEAIAEVVAGLLHQPTYEYWQDVGRHHYERFHHPARVAERLVGFYEQVLDKQTEGGIENGG